MCWCVLPPMVGRAVLARGPFHARACCVVVGLPSWWGVLCWCVARLLVKRAVLVPAAVVVCCVVVLGLGCRLCRLGTGVVEFGLVVC